MNTVNQHPRTLITRGFYITALYNIIAFIVFSKFLTNDYLASLDPQVFSKLGWVSILLWGCAYLSVSKSYHHVPWLIFIFFVEKMVYTGMWIYWLVQHGAGLPEVYKNDVLTGIVLSIYGAGDFISGLFFLWVSMISKKQN